MPPVPPVVGSVVVPPEDVVDACVVVVPPEPPPPTLVVPAAPPVSCSNVKVGKKHARGASETAAVIAVKTDRAERPRIDLAVAEVRLACFIKTSQSS
ncbi:MAG: hypothetical protein IPK82_41155 [Polyangiaceae bacterium]|nr:hypothetical protein [Polyangiaceae bacterium]